MNILLQKMKNHFSYMYTFSNKSFLFLEFIARNKMALSQIFKNTQKFAYARPGDVIMQCVLYD